MPNYLPSRLYQFAVPIDIPLVHTCYFLTFQCQSVTWSITLLLGCITLIRNEIDHPFVSRGHWVFLILWNTIHIICSSFQLFVFSLLILRVLYKCWILIHYELYILQICSHLYPTSSPFLFPPSFPSLLLPPSNILFGTSSGSIHVSSTHHVIQKFLVDSAS